MASTNGYEMENTNLLQELATLAARKRHYLNTVRATTESLVSQFTENGNTYCLFATGTARQVASQITASLSFDHDHGFSAAMILTAVAGELKACTVSGTRG